jgi:hypothetical protein
MTQPSSSKQNPDRALAASLAKLWPHREHESNAVRALLCRCALHGWRKLDLRELAPDKDVQYCFWCSKLRIDGVIHDA